MSDQYNMLMRVCGGNTYKWMLDAERERLEEYEDEDTELCEECFKEATVKELDVNSGCCNRCAMGR